MDLETFLTAIYCLTDDFLAGQKPRQRGPQPTLSDSEVLTMEIAGEFLGIDTDPGLFRSLVQLGPVQMSPATTGRFTKAFRA